ncbi:MAG: hypothetical protein LBB84_05955 [Tannerellaceae bacterium]|nr:hypothetical protein [Tannerellaceae bacterium]
MSQRSKRIAALILITVFAFYYANIRFFYHSHIINGATIVHSHIYSKATAQTHTHSPTELKLISSLSVFLSLQVGICFVHPSIYLLLLVFILPSFSKRILSDSMPCISLRAPPSSGLNIR